MKQITQLAEGQQLKPWSFVAKVFLDRGVIPRLFNGELTIRFSEGSITKVIKSQNVRF